MPSPVFYSISPFGTGDIKVAANITITSGVAVLTEAQTGNIGAGCQILFNTSESCWIAPNRIGFDSGGVTELLRDTKIAGGTSGATGIVRYVELLSGAWGDGDAAGWIYFESTTGTFQDDEQINRTKPTASSNIATTDGTIEGNIGNGNTEFVVKSAIGADAANQTIIAVDQIHHEYASLSAFEAGFTDASHINNVALTTADVVAHACCYYDHDNQTADSTTFVIDGMTTDVTRYIMIFTPMGNAESINKQRHSGVWDGNKYILVFDTVTNHAMLVKDNYTIIEGVQVTGNSGQTLIMVESANYCSLLSNIAKDHISNASRATLRGYSTDYTKIINNLVYGSDGASLNQSGITVESGSEYCDIYHNTVYGCSEYGIHCNNAANHPLVINNLAYDDPTNDFNGSFDGNSDYNFSKDNLAPGANSIHGDTDDKTPDFVDVGAGTENFNLEATSDAIEEGTSLAASEGIWRDIAGNERGATPDIGAFEYVAAGSVSASISPSVSPSISASPSATQSPSASLSASISPSVSPSASISPSISLSISASISPSISPSISLSPSASISFSPSASISPSISASVSPSASASISPSPSASISLSPSPSLSPSISPSISASISLSISPSTSISPSVSPSISFSVSPSRSPSISLSPSASISASISLSPSKSISPSISLSPSASVSPSASISASISLSPSASVSPSVSPSLSASISLSISPSISPSISLSISQSISQSISASISPSVSPSASISASISLSISASLSPSVSPSASISQSISPSGSASISASISPSISLSPSASISPSISLSQSPSASVSPSPSCPINCAECEDCIKITIADLSGTCEVDCADYNGTYELTQVGDTCVWQYTSGNIVISLTCSGRYWWIKVVNDGAECAVWKSAIADDTDCPPIGGFVPSGSPVGHWSADTITGLEDGDPVATWPDQSGNENDLVQATAPYRPTYQTNELNGLPIVQYDEVDDKLTSAYLLGAATDYSFYMVFQEGTRQNYDGFIQGATGWGSIGMHGSAEGRIYLEGGNLNRTATNYYAANTWYVMDIIKDGTAVGNENARINGGSDTSSPSAVPAPSSDTHVFGGPQANDVAEYIMYALGQSDANRNLNEAGLNTKYSLY